MKTCSSKCSKFLFRLQNGAEKLTKRADLLTRNLEKLIDVASGINKLRTKLITNGYKHGSSIEGNISLVRWDEGAGKYERPPRCGDSS